MSTILNDAELRLPRQLVSAACVEMRRHGAINMDTAALLIENGADLTRLETQVWEQADQMEME